ncbi:hypothetical protein B0O99DRAFT_712376, partial [Bisporella sp. PMI_857]
FRDAVIITRRLEYKYLWIDSLCIIQDSKEDGDERVCRYERHILGVGSEYICRGLEDCNEGCFSTRNPLRHRPCILMGDEQEGMVITTRFPSEWRNYEDSTTLPRNWAFRERILAPRTLRYEWRTTSWECIYYDATEG